VSVLNYLMIGQLSQGTQTITTRLWPLPPSFPLPTTLHFLPSLYLSDNSNRHQIQAVVSDTWHR